MAGPATRPIWNSAWNMALTEATSPRGTRFGRIADSPASVVAVKPAAIAGRTNNGHSTGPASALTASPALHSSVSSCAPNSTRRRSAASASEPPSKAPAISGSTCASETSPTWSDERVSAYTWYATATMVSWAPSVDSSWPATRLRRSRDRRSGDTSTRTCRPIRASRFTAAGWSLVCAGPEERDGGQVTYDPVGQRQRVPVPARQPPAQFGGRPGDGGLLHDLKAEGFQRARVVTRPRPSRIHVLPGGQPVLLLERPLAVGVQRDQRARKAPGDAGDDLRSLVEVDKHALGREEVRPGAIADSGQPVLVQHRSGNHPAAAGIGEEPAPQLDRVRQVQVDPVHLTVIDPVKPAIEPGADLHHCPARMLREEVTDPAVEDRGAQEGDATAPAAPVLLGVEVHRCEDLGRLRVPEHRPPSARLPRPGSQRNEQRLLDRAEFHLYELCHTSHYTRPGYAGTAPGGSGPSRTAHPRHPAQLGTVD